jgi:hypothetical protein
MTPEPISAAYFMNPSHLPEYICFPYIFARQRLVKHVPAAVEELLDTQACVRIFVSPCRF